MGPGGRAAARRRLLVLLLPPLLSALPLYVPVRGLESFRRDPAGIVVSDRRGEVLACLGDEGGAFAWKLSWQEIPAEAREVFLNLEDRRFYRHRGVDPLAIVRAAALNLRQGRTVSGASTITMQLARMVRPHAGGLSGKLLEALTALRLEAQLGKREILRLYLNRLPFGRNTLGLGAASVRYFDRPVAELSRAQLLILATIPRAPAVYDPFEAPGALLARAAALAPRLGVTERELAEALGSCRPGDPPRRAPHFVRRVRADLAARGSDRSRREIVRVITTLDVGLDREMRAVVREKLARKREAGRPGPPGAGPASVPVLDAGLLALANGGEVLAWVGAPENAAFLDAIEVRSSSGSTLKPFLYALALENGYTAASLLPDLPLSFGVAESYRPENFDRKSRAAVRLRTALASSLNAPAVHLLSRLGLEEFLALCGRLGFAFPAGASARYGLGAAVGNAEVTLEELTRAFTVFPNRGELRPLRRIAAVVTAEGEREPWPAPERARRVFRAEDAWLIGNILSDPGARATGFGASSRFNTLPRAMFKSGTSSEYESLWCLGATESHTVGVWAGNLDGRPAFGTTGSSLPAAIALAALEVLGGSRGPAAAAPGRPPVPAGLKQVRICTVSGLPASPNCPGTRIEFLPVEPSPRTMSLPERCPLHGSSGETRIDPLELLKADLLAGLGGAPRILFPLPEQLFYRDGAVAPGAQRLEAWVAAPPQDSLSVRITGDSSVILPAGDRLEYPFRVALPLEPGTYRLEVSGPKGSDSVRYHVR